MLKQKINFKKVKKTIIDGRFSKLILLANDITSKIKIRTRDKGLDVNNKSFKPYTKEYAKQKTASHGSSKVNLTASSKMLNAITWSTHKAKSKIRFYFNSSEQRAKAVGNQFKNKRKFFGVDTKLQSWIKTQLSKL